jgi:replicative DNA helicase
MADDKSIEKVRKARDRLIPVFQKFHVDDEGGVSANYITSISRKKKLEWGEIGLIIVDYLHIMQVGADKNQTDALGDAVKQLRGLGKELGCPVLLLSQLNRSGEGNSERKKARRPELSDLRGSGDIEQSADVVLFLYRDSYYDEMGFVPDEDMVEVLVRKHRNGRTGVTNLRWIPRYVKFTDL